MLHKQPNSVITLAILLALVGVSKPAKAFLIAQSDSISTTFTVPDQLPDSAKVQIAASNSTQSINQSLKKSFIAKYPQAQINIETQESTAALESLSSGKVDLVAIGRSLTAAEKAQGFSAIPVSREKIAIVVSKDNNYDGSSLSISQFAQIFRGEINNWSELGGSPGQIKVIDLPDTNDTRQAFPSYPVFQAQEFATGSNAVQLEQDSIEEMIAQLGENGIGYAVANDVISRDDVKVVTLHQTQPDDPRYPFSQPFNLIYQGTPSEAAQAFLGFATTDAGQQVIDERVGSISTTAAGAIADSNLDNKSTSGASDIASSSKADTGSITGDDAILGDGGIEGSGKLNPDVAGSGEINPDVAGSGEINPDVAESGEINSDVAGSGEINSDVTESGQANLETDLQGEGSAATADEDTTTGEGTTIADADVEGGDQANLETDLQGESSAATADGDTTIGEETAIADADVEVGDQANLETDFQAEGGSVTPGAESNGEASSIPSQTDAENQDVANTANKGKWWWWLPLLLLPLGALALYLFGRKEKSDQEPAITSFIDPNAPQGEDNLPVPPTDNLSSGTSTIASEQSGVASGTVGNASPIGGATLAAGGAAIASGAAAVTNLVGGQTRAEEDLDLDQVELEEESSIIDLKDGTKPDTDVNLDLEAPAVEIPSNPVNEFTDQKTKLQVTDQPTILQTDEEDEIDNITSSLLDDVSQTGDAAMSEGTAIAGGAAGASGLFRDSEDSDPETSNDSEQPTILQTDDVDVIDQSSEDVTIEVDQFNAVSDSVDDIATPEVDLVLDQDSIENDPGFIDQGSELGGAALGGVAAAASGFLSNQDTEQITELQENEVEFSVEEATSNNFADNVIADAETSPWDFEPDAESASSETEFSLESSADINLVSDSLDEVATTEADLFLEQNSNENAPSFLDQVTQTGEASPEASGFFSNQDTEQTTELQENEIEFSLEETISNDEGETSPFNFETNNELESAGTDLSAEAPDIVSGSLESMNALEFDLSVEENQDLDNKDKELTLEEIASSDFVSELETTPNNLSSSLDEIAFENINNSEDEDINFDDITFEDTDNSINASLDELTFDNINNSEDEDIGLDDITFEDTDNTSIDELLNDLGTATDDQEISLDDLGIDQTNDSSTTDLVSNNTTQNVDLSDEQAEDINDMGNISQWLDNLETPNNNADNISEWLDQLTINTDDNNLEEENQNNENFAESKDDTEEISFQFLEDLLERDSNTNHDN